MKADVLPPWIAHDEREREAMERWVNQELNKIRVRQFTHVPLTADNLVKLATHHGNLQPLRARFPSLHIRMRGRGKHRRVERKWAIDQAVEDVERIRALWLEHYKCWKRPKDQLSAEEIAARRWEVDPQVVANALKEKSRA